MNLYGLIIGISLIIGVDYFSKHQQIIPKNRLNIFIIGLLFSLLVGARAYHVADQWSYYSQHLSQIPTTWNGGLAIYGALIAATIYICLYSLIFKISALSILNFITPILPLCQALGRLGNFFNHEIPLWWLEASLNLILFFLLKKSKHPTAHYLIAYGLIRFFFEFFRHDTWTINEVKIAQLISVLSFVFGLILIKHEKIKIVQKDH